MTGFDIIFIGGHEKIFPNFCFFLVDFSNSFGVLNFKGEKSIRDNSFYSSLEY